MPKRKFFLWTALLFFSCKLTAERDRRTLDSHQKVYHLRLQPKAGSQYRYTVSSQTSIQTEIEGKKFEHMNGSEIQVLYDIEQDSSGNFIFQIHYEDLQLFSKANDPEKKQDEEQDSVSGNFISKALTVLKTQSISAVVSPAGEVIEMQGLTELSDRLVVSLGLKDQAALAAIRSQLDKMMGRDMVKGHLDQLLKIFPDSAIRIGDKWKISSAANEDPMLNSRSSFILKDVNDEIAFLQSASELDSGPNPLAIMGYTVIPQFKGKQEGSYEVETKSGMIMHSEVVSEVQGTMQMQGRQMPLVINVKSKINGRKIN
ncbi:MAG: DUF6263 family protein [Flavisolibacter sp.]